MLFALSTLTASLKFSSQSKFNLRPTSIENSLYALAMRQINDVNIKKITVKAYLLQ